MPSVQATLASLQAVADQIVAEVKAQAKNQATVVALVGELGAGKTTFTQVFGQGLGINQEAIRSPSFVLQKIYHLGPRGGPFKQLIHIDCYRLDGVDELQHLNWTEIISDPGNLIVVEWADKIESALPAQYLKIEFTVASDTERLINWGWSTQ